MTFKKQAGLSFLLLLISGTHPLIGSAALPISTALAACTVNAASPAAITGNAPQVDGAVGTDCATAPDNQMVTFYKVALCTAKPAAPTSAAAADLSSCTTFMSSPCGAPVSISLNATAPFAADSITSPPTGTYTYAYAEVDAHFGIQKTALFAAQMYDTQPSPGNGRGIYCWSLAATGGATFYNYTAANNFLSGATRCDATPGTAGVTYTAINSFDGNSFVNGVTFVNAQANHAIDGYLVDVNSNLVVSGTRDSMGSVTKIAAIMPINITVTSATTELQLMYNTSLGATISRAWSYCLLCTPRTPSGLPAVMIFKPSSFDMNIAEVH